MHTKQKLKFITVFVSVALLAVVMNACAHRQTVKPEQKKHVQQPLAPPQGEEEYVAPDEQTDDGDPLIGYSEVGVASWYGPNFQGKPTASGEPFDMFKISAAHRTLPLGTTIDVANLDNGKTIRLTINDRGPYAHGRILDCSMAAAEALGYKNAGKANVRITVVSSNAQNGPSTHDRAVSPESGTITIGQYESWWKADRLRQFLKGRYATIRIIGLDGDYRVVIGPFSNEAVKVRITEELKREGYDVTAN
jgi:rare lipoprotein A